MKQGWCDLHDRTGPTEPTHLFLRGPALVEMRSKHPLCYVVEPMFVGLSNKCHRRQPLDRMEVKLVYAFADVFADGVHERHWLDRRSRLEKDHCKMSISHHFQLARVMLTAWRVELD